MSGLIIISGLILYLWILFWVTRRVYRRAISRDHSKALAFFLGGLAFLILYLPVFWDFLPLLAMKKYFCSKDGGTTVYQTAAEWVKDNPERARNVWFYKWGEQPKTTQDGVDLLGNRFGSKFFQVDVIKGWIKSSEIHLFDIETGKVLAVRREYSSTRGPGYPTLGVNNYKFWLNTSGCDGMDDYWNVANAFNALGVEK